MGELKPTPFAAGYDLVALGLATPAEVARYTAYFHDSGPGKALIVVTSTDVFSLEEAHATQFGIPRWRHASISVVGALNARLEDQRRIGRVREGGERSPAPLPDWYDLTHVAYEHAAELGFDPHQPVWQYLPPLSEKRLNIAEALHLRQPR